MQPIMEKQEATEIELQAPEVFAKMIELRIKHGEASLECEGMEIQEIASKGNRGGTIGKEVKLHFRHCCRRKVWTNDNSRSLINDDSCSIPLEELEYPWTRNPDSHIKVVSSDTVRLRRHNDPKILPIDSFADLHMIVGIFD
jgi:hypothetical protein